MAKNKKNRGNRRNLKLERVKDYEKEQTILDLYIKNKLKRSIKKQISEYPVLSQEQFEGILEQSKIEANSCDEASEEEFKKILERIRVENDEEEEKYIEEMIIKLNDNELNVREPYMNENELKKILDSVEDDSIRNDIVDNLRSIRSEDSESDYEYEYESDSDFGEACSDNED